MQKEKLICEKEQLTWKTIMKQFVLDSEIQEKHKPTKSQLFQTQKINQIASWTFIFYSARAEKLFLQISSCCYKYCNWARHEYNFIDLLILCFPRL
jgi:hypothetical protein